MQKSNSRFQKYIFVCERERDDGACCAPEGIQLRQHLKNMTKEKGLSSKIRVSQAGCLDVCSDGPNVLVMPDNIWYSKVGQSDLNEILNAAIEGLV